MKNNNQMLHIKQEVYINRMCVLKSLLFCSVSSCHISDLCTKQIWLQLRRKHWNIHASGCIAAATTACLSQTNIITQNRTKEVAVSNRYTLWLQTDRQQKDRQISGQRWEQTMTRRVNDENYVFLLEVPWPSVVHWHSTTGRAMCLT